jgi:hypothetical protein
VGREEVEAYLCGLVAADGHVERHYVTLAQKDRRFVDIIISLLREIDVRISSVFYDRGAGVWKIKVSDPRFKTFLINNGVPEGAKSHRLKPPGFTGSLALMYIAGFIDGDGWVEQVARGNRRYLRIGLKTKSRELRDWMYAVLMGEGIEASKADKKDGYEIHIDSVKAWEIAQLLKNPGHRDRLAQIRDDRLSHLHP